VVRGADITATFVNLVTRVGCSVASSINIFGKPLWTVNTLAILWIFQRLKATPEYESLMLLSECDRNGDVPVESVPDLDDVLDALRELARTCGCG
jgi:hypothetical protein